MCQLLGMNANTPTDVMFSFAGLATRAHEQVQSDGRIRRWARIDEAGGRWLRVVLLPDGETVHNAFFDRGFEP